MTTIDKYQDILDVRDIIARFEELESDIKTFTSEPAGAKEAVAVELMQEELAGLKSLLEDLKGNGGDEQWRGDWYPVTLVRDSYFKEYAQELAEGIGAYDPRGLQWPLTCIDWEQASRELRMDYSSVEFDGVTYWYW